MSAPLRRLGLIVRSAPWQGRSGRDALDIALASATLDLELELFFVGEGVQQLLADRTPERAGLPAGWRAWASLGELAPTRFHVEAATAAALEDVGARWLVAPELVDAEVQAERQAACDRLLVV